IEARSMIFIYSTFPNNIEAAIVGESLVKKKLAGCCNIFPIESVYSWKGKVVKEKETAVIIKTEKKNFKKIESFILKNHSYDTPCIIEIPLSRITEKYSSWLKKNLT
ncbi:MAG: divalent-cation tolerance protein CutA, partial [bacterium]|nr:divalent-cation tolerance protein CutA [bacterium]